MTARLRFLGAARQVTGSKHLLSIDRCSVLLDCGLVQGPRRLSNQLNRDLPLRVKELDAVVLSHAHIDHSGSLPRLVKLGYRGPIYCTSATRDLLSILLPDSAHLQASDARYLRKRGHSFEPAYDLQDVERTLQQIQPIEYGQAHAIHPDIQLEFLDAGHILGSAQVILDFRDGRKRSRLAFTGDLGRKRMPILRDPEPLPECQVLITESTYGDRLHPTARDSIQEIQDFFRDRRREAGRILIPAFSVGRTQEILWHLGHLIRSKQIDPLPIYVDSPLSTRATRIVARHQGLFDRKTQAVLAAGYDPFFFDGVRCVADVDESKSLNQLRQGIIISASGMCEGGRILHHLAVSLARPEDCVLLVGFQAENTLGRKLLNGSEVVKLFGEQHRVRCRVHNLEGLSAHADSAELADHLRPLARTARQVFVVHGEEEASKAFAERLAGVGFRDVVVPLHKEEFELKL